MFDDVTDTALWVAAYRARESARPDALFRDEWAARLAGERGEQLAREVANSAGFAWSVVVRTGVIDELLRETIENGADTVVNLGAGMDARPFRLSLPPGLRWIEVDAPKIVSLKEERLPAAGARCRLQRVALDLADAGARREFLRAFPGDDVIALTEGVIGYLENDQVDALAREPVRPRRLDALPAFRAKMRTMMGYAVLVPTEARP